MASYDALLWLDGVKGESRLQPIYPSLALLVADLRQRSKGYLLTSVAHGVRSEAREVVQRQLRRLGVFERFATDAHPVLAAAPGFIAFQAEAPAAQRAKPIPVLLVIAHQQDFARPSTAEQQQLRAAQRSLELPASCRIFVGAGAPAAARDHQKWTELESMSL